MLEDNAIQKKIEKTSKQLQEQYSLKQKPINEKKFKKSKKQKVFSIIYDCLSVLFILICSFVCFSVINSKVKNTPPCIANCSVVRISSSSMVASGFEVGDYIAIQKVNTKTLNVGDKIAFYTYPASYQSFNINICTLVDSEDIAPLEYTSSITSFLGIQPSSLVSAGRSGSQVVFHEVYRVLEDDDGNRWFQTKGTSNKTEDNWFIAENMIVGAYQDNSFANSIAYMLGIIANSSFLLLLIIAVPIALIIFSLVKDYSKDLKIAIIENEIVRGKRKLNDPFCVEHKIGSNLSEKEKYKVLAQASEDEKIEYINLLWLGKKPTNIQKHYLRRRMKLREYEEKLKLHNTCEEMLANTQDIKKITTYYLKEKAKIEKKQVEINRRLKVLAKKHTQTN